MRWLSNAVVDRLIDATASPQASGRYQLHEELGTGGMGTVYRATDLDLERAVAIKVVRASVDPALSERLRIEARVLAGLEHPGIVPIHDVGTLDDGRLFYVMKLVRGRTLTHVIPELTELEQRLAVFERICETIAFAHERGIVHRDLKPDNIMVGSFGEVLILDWGTAKLLSATESQLQASTSASTNAHTVPGTVLGTPGFMPPEQASGRAAEVDRRADVFALGTILSQLIADQHAPRQLRAICTQAMSPDANARYTDAGALRADLERYRFGHAVEAYRETPWDRLGRLIARYRTPILLVLAYIVMRTIVALAAR